MHAVTTLMTATRSSAGGWRKLALRRGVPVALLVLGCLLSVAASWFVASTRNARVRAGFLADVAQVRNEIRSRIDTRFDVVRAAAALFSGRREIDLEDFRAFVAALRIRERYPSILGIGFARRLNRPELPSHASPTPLGIGRPSPAWPPGRRAEYFPVLSIEPMEEANRATIGFDLAADATVRAVMETARDSGEATSSRRLARGPLVGAGAQSVFVLVIPVYAFQAQHRTSDERRRALVGYVFSTFDPARLLSGILPPRSERAVGVYDETVADEAALLRSSAMPRGGRYDSVEPIEVAGRDWLIAVRSGASQAGFVSSFDYGTLGGSLLLSLLLFVITRAQVRALDVAGQHESALRVLAQHDPLTQLPNRALFGEHLAKAMAMARRHGKGVAVLFMDVDRFKHINDSLGHEVGDQILQSVAGRLVSCVRGSDTVSRHGGDEFVLLLTDIDNASHAATRAQKIIGALATPFTVAGHQIDTTLSVGISLFPHDGEEVETLIRAADAAMYQAKERGLNHYAFFMPDMSTRAIERRRIEGGLRRALGGGQFVLHYQPKICLDTGAIAGTEALIRWADPERGLVAPGTFVPIAEDCGLIVPIGGWVLREACRQARSWVDAGKPVAVAVNISAIEFRNEAFLDNVRSVLEETGLPPGYLEIELTESALMQHAATAASVLRALKDLGVKIALDDFGTGYSSLSYLRQFPIDVLKVDQSFVHEITDAARGSSIVSGIISIGRSLGHRVIAEGVETAEQLAFLREHQCDEGQGFYFGRPVEADELATLLV